MKRTKIYISLPISGLDISKVREKADLIKAKLSREGYDVVNPFEVFAGKDPTYDDYICQDLRKMLDCDAIYFCHGWHLSCGCCIEHGVALTYKQFEKKEFKIMYER